MAKLRFGIAGSGGMGAQHGRWIVADKHRDFRLAAVADADAARARKVGEELGVPFFTDAQAMFDSGLIDAVLVATPHYDHAPLAIRAARAGLHVLCEKPLAVTVGAARAMIAECRRRKVAFGAMLNQRTRTVMRTMKRMIEAGRLGEIFRVQMICSSWYRTQAYYDGGAWRGTWDGEGGGILLNQAPHSLDLFQWLGGMPKRILATVGTRWHRIEVENTANAICEYGNGKTGYIYATTAEAPGVEQYMFCGDRGTLVCEDGKLRFARLKTSLRKHLMTSREIFKRPDFAWEELASSDDMGGRHIDVVRAFVAHVLRGSPMVATGAEAVNELELSNAIYIAGFKNKAVELPVNAAEMDRLLASLERKHSTGRGQGVRARADREMRRLMGKQAIPTSSARSGPPSAR